MALIRFLRRHQQASNLTGLVLLATVPMYFYARSDRVPKSDEELQHTLKRFAPEKLGQDTQRKAADMSEFWKKRGPGVASLKDEDFQKLLKAGKSSMKRHYELTGPLAEQEKAGNAGASLPEPQSPPKP